jgi:uncharacterized caspase-like protein
MRLAFMAACAVALLAALPAAAANRVALVIGNNAYENVPQLQKAVNDADAIASELSKLGFDVVKAENVGRRAMSRALVELEGKIAPGDTALVYFAGHGFAIDGTNYLLPVDVPAANPGEEVLVEDASFAANGLSDRLQQKGAATVILILDACRDNPFAMQGKRSIGLTRGLTRMDPAEGMFVLFSAGQGQSALDRLSETDANPNSVFHAHPSRRDGDARPVDGADRQEDAEQGARACRQGRSYSGAGLLRPDRRRPLSLA